MNDAKRILIASPDDILRTVLAEQFGHQGFRVATAASEPEVAALCKGGIFDGALVDAAIGFGALSAMASHFDENGGRFPIIALGVENEAATEWLEMGAGACVKKPIRVPPLFKQLERLMRVQQPDALQIGSFVFDGVARALEGSDGQRVMLTEKEVAIIAYLAEAGERAVPREELLAEVWGYADEATTHTVETHVYRLRRKLSEISAAFLLTEDGGYRLERKA